MRNITRFSQISPIVSAIIGTGFSLNVVAGSPVAYDQWSNVGGVISATCPTGFTCEDGASDQGMMQRFITNVATGDRYIQQIIDDDMGSKGTMKLESFVYSSNSPVSGIASKQVITHNTALQNFDATILLNTGWANEGDNTVDIHQFMDSTDTPVNNTYYTDTFKFQEKRDQTTGERIGKYVDISQGQLNSTFIQGDGVTSGNDQYSFVNKIVSGTFNQSTATVSLADNFGGGMMGSGGSGGGTLSWNVGDEIQVIWLGQHCDRCGTTNIIDFMFQSYENMSTGNIISGQAGNTTAPQNWEDPPFGAIPTLIQY